MAKKETYSVATLTITPLGAAIVEAMPNRKKMTSIQRSFKRSNRCPTSEIFSAEQVVKFYRDRGQAVIATHGGLKS